MTAAVSRRRLGPAIVLGVLAGELLMSGLLAWQGASAARRTAHALAGQQRLVAPLQLSDLALWSGASYCRHPVETDLFAPFAEHPAALEHSPGGSFVPPFAIPILRSVVGGGR